MKPGTLTTVVLAAGTFALAACGGSSSRPELTDDDLDRILSDPRTERLEAILDRSDTLLVSSYHMDYSLSLVGQTVAERVVEKFTCAGTRCSGDDGTELSLQDLAVENPSDQIRNPPDADSSWRNVAHRTPEAGSTP